MEVRALLLRLDVLKLDARNALQLCATLLRRAATSKGSAAEKYSILHTVHVGIIGEFYFGTFGEYSSGVDKHPHSETGEVNECLVYRVDFRAPSFSLGSSAAVRPC